MRASKIAGIATILLMFGVVVGAGIVGIVFFMLVFAS